MEYYYENYIKDILNNINYIIKMQKVKIRITLNTYARRAHALVYNLYT